MFLVFNLIYSQLISPLYFQLAKEDKTAVTDFLSKIKNLPVFSSFLEINKNIYGNSLEAEVFAESVKRKQSIKEYESYLQKNPASRDVLYNLYLLYQDNNNQIKAKEYLNKTKELDPLIQN